MGAAKGIPVCVVVVAATCAVGVAGCNFMGFGGCSCHDESCNRMVVAGHAATDADAAVTWNGKAMPLVDAHKDRSAPDGFCWMMLEPLEGDDRFIPGSTAFYDPSRVMNGRCASQGQEFTFSVRLGDLRSMDAGSYELEAGGSGKFVGAQAPDCTTQAKAKLTILEATGGKAPFPALVTQDFSRSLLIEFTADTSGEASCRAAATAHFVVIASDYVGIPNTSCQMCAC